MPEGLIEQLKKETEKKDNEEVGKLETEELKKILEWSEFDIKEEFKDIKDDLKNWLQKNKNDILDVIKQITWLGKNDSNEIELLKIELKNIGLKEEKKKEEKEDKFENIDSDYDFNITFYKYWNESITWAWDEKELVIEQLKNIKKELRDKLLDFLKTNEIKKFQIEIWMKENDSDKVNKADWYFWPKTFNKLKNFAKQNPVDKTTETEQKDKWEKNTIDKTNDNNIITEDKTKTKNEVINNKTKTTDKITDEKNIIKETDNPNIVKEEDEEKKPPREYTKSPEYIDEKNNKYTKIDKIKYANLEKNKVNNYRDAPRDKKKAIQWILDYAKKSELRSVNRDDLTEILDNILDTSFIQEVLDDEDNTKIDKDKFKTKFKKEFVKTDKYDRKWILNTKEINKIADIIQAWLNDDTVRDKLQRLADIWDASKNINYTSTFTDETLIKSVSADKIFLFLCDFDNNWTVDSSDINKKEKRKNKTRDTWSMMWWQLYTNLTLYADIVREDIDGDGIQEKKIIEWAKTSALISNILNAVYSRTENSSLKKAIDYFIKTSWPDYTPEEFYNLIQSWKYEDSNGEIKDTSSTMDIKQFMRSLGNWLNEWRDLSEMFNSKENIKNILSQEVKFYKDYTVDLHSSDPFCAVFEWKFKTSVSEISELQKLYNEGKLEGVRQTFANQMMRTVNLITDLIYLDFSQRWISPLTAIAGVFSWSKIWAINYTFYNPDWTVNEKETRTALGEYITRRFMPSIWLAVDENWNPVLGWSLKREKTSDDLSNRFWALFTWNINPVRSILDWEVKFNFNLWLDEARQINKANVKKLDTKKPIPVNRIWIEEWVGLNLQSISPYLWVFFERDFPAGIEQKARVFDKMMKGVLWMDKSLLYEWWFPIYEDIASFKSGLNSSLDKKITSNSDLKDNELFFRDMIEELGNQMEFSWVFDLIKEQKGIGDKETILKFVYSAFINGFHENAINQKFYEQLNKWIKLTKFGVRVKLTEILINAWVGAGIWLVWWPFGSLIWWWVGTLVGMARFSTYKTSYVEDATKSWYNYRKIENWYWSTNIGPEASKDFDKLQTSLENLLNPTSKNLKVEIKDWIISIVPDSKYEKIWPSVCDHINVYYNKNNKNQISFDGNKLLIWWAPIRITHNVKRDKTETFLFIWEDPNKPWVWMTKLTKTSIIDKDLKPNKIEEKIYYKERDLISITTKIWENSVLLPFKDEILKWCFDAKWHLLTTWEEVTTWTLKITRKVDGTFGIVYDKTSPTDKLDIKYTREKEIKKETVKEKWFVVETEINLDKLFNFEAWTDLYKAQDLLNTLQPTIKQDERKKLTDFYDLMASASNIIWNTWEIDKEEIDKAIWSLTKILWETNELSKFIKELPSEDYETRAYIIDRIKQTFAIEDGYQNLTINKLFKARKEHYKTLSSAWLPNFPSGIDRSLITGKWNLDAKFDLNQKKKYENLIWYTAFYRWQKNSNNRRYSMTAPWDTSVYGNFISDPLKLDNLSKSKEWFIANLKVNKYERELLLKSISTKIPKDYKDYITSDNLLGFLDKWELSIDNWKKIIKLNADYVFYLLWECANESLWLRVNSVKITDNQTVYETEKWIIHIHEDYEWTIDMSWWMSWKMTWWYQYKKLGVDISTWAYNSDYDARISQRDLNLVWVFTKWSKEIDNQWVDEETDNQWTKKGNWKDNQWTWIKKPIDNQWTWRKNNNQWTWNQKL